MKTSTNKRSQWSSNRYAWTIAITLILVMILMELIFSLTKNFESLPWRMLNLFFLLGGFLFMVYDYSKHRVENVSYLDAFKLCLRTGGYFIVMFFPLLLLALGFDHTDLHRLQIHTAFQSQQEPFAIIGALIIEVPVFIIIASIASSPLAGIANNKN